ncbi:MAG: AMP-binding protein, partial [Candidatus Competibacteraceae bacterium]|nr:AMP-binding protein [Candidatus Competibacteraceae bacterium]
MSAAQPFIEARDFLIRHREDYDTAYRQFRWPKLDRFNWALDYFDTYAQGNQRLALWVVDDNGSEARLSYAQLSERSSRVANFLRARGVQRGERVLLMVNNVVPLWESMLACIKLGAVMIPATTLLTEDDLRDRLERGKVAHVIAGAQDTAKFEGLAGDYSRICVGGEVAGWSRFADAYECEARFQPQGETRADDTLLLYFTSGTTSKPKLVEHTHQSYPVGHLSTLYWIGLREGDTHLNISSPGWAKHAWSNFFAPFNAGATVFVYNYGRFDA